MSILKNSYYSLGGKVINIIITMGGMAVLARLLTPNDFGIIAIILGIQTFFNSILDMGLGPVYIKKKVLTTAFVSSFFTINVYIGIANVVYLIGSIFIVNSVYDGMDYTNYILLFTLSVIFTSISLIYQFNLTKTEQFNKLFIVNVMANVFSLLIAIIMALLDYGVYALIIKIIAYSLFSMILLIYFNSNLKLKIVSFNIIKRYIIELKFGIEIFFYRITSGAFDAFDKLIIAKFYSTEIIGNYNQSKNLAMMTDSILRTSLTTVVFARLEKMQDMKQEYYLKYYGIIFLISLIVPIIFYFFGDYIILVWLGSQWIMASLMIKPLSLFVIGSIMKGIITMISMHENKMKTLNYVNIFISITFLCLLLFFLKMQIELLSILYYISSVWLGLWFVSLLIVLFYHTRRNNYD